MAINTASPGHPVQLVSENEKGDLTFHKAALMCCLAKVKDVPVCLISVAGQQRMGKSFLLNVLLQKLTQAEDGCVMAQEKDPIGGFKSQVCEDTVTKGIWIWSQPCLIDTKSGKVAVFLLDTEGTMDFQQKSEKSLKLSAFSILLSSYSIVNVAKQLKETDFEYLELFIDCMEKLQEAMGSQSEPIQQLDFVIRDCDFTDDYSQQDAKQYLANTTQVRRKFSKLFLL
uniref:GB1/RHD3-type G domain-containing protein n=1 Tax=Sphenodon punctatus TaxID=8508 RepID=A0A8D0G2M9_SPHPU